MIDLDVPSRTVAGIDLAGDDGDPFAFWVLPPQPRVAIVDGSPQVNLLRFIGAGQITGGLLEVTLELAHTADELEKARQQLAVDLKDDRNRVTLNQLPLVSAEAEVLFLGRETRADGSISAVVRRPFGAAMPKLLPPYTASFSATLTPEGVQLADAALRSGGAPMGVAYRLNVEALRPAQRIVAHLDWGRIYDNFSSESKSGNLFTLDDIRRISESLVESRAISIQVIQPVVPDPAAPSPDLTQALEWIEREIVDKLCVPVMPLDRRPARASLGTLGDMFGVGSEYGFKNEQQIERSIADVEFTARTVVVRTLTQQVHLADLLGGADPVAHIADVQPADPFFDRVSLHVATARPLDKTFTREVVGRFTYGTTVSAIHLDASNADGSASTWADKSASRTWQLPLDVTLADNAPVDPGTLVHLPGASGQGRELTLDLEALLGLWSVQIEGAPDTRVVATSASLQHTRAGAAVGDPCALILAAPIHSATAWFRDFRAGDGITCAVKHLLQDGRAIDVAPTPVDTRLFRLPAPFPGSMTVQIIADEDWSDLQRIVVSVQKSADQPAGTFVLDHAGAMAAVALDLPDPADRTYRYKVMRTLSTGDQTDDWQTTDASVLFVGRVAADKLVVDVRTLGTLELPEAGINTIEVMLQYIDPANQLRDIETAVLHARSDSYHWEVALKDPTRRAYQYQVTVHRDSGKTEVGPFSTSSDSSLYVPIVKG